MKSVVKPQVVRLGAMLKAAALITEEQIQKALEQQKIHGGKIGSHLVKLGFITEKEITEFLGKQFKMPTCVLSELEIDKAVFKLIPGNVALKYTVLPVKKEGRKLTVAMADPTNIFVLDDLKFLTRCDINPVVTTESAILEAIENFYDTYTSADDALADIVKDMEDVDLEILEEAEEEDLAVNLLQEQVQEAPVVKLINGLLADAVKLGASDIHIECFEKSMRVRYRIDGVLQDRMSPKVKMKAAIVSRVKIMANLDIAERRIPQDGRIKIKLGNKVIDFRVSTLPTLFGEKIVLRILDKTNLTLDLTKFGIEEKPLENLMKAISAPYGMVLVTGPTGSGKTTTLYSALSKLNIPDVNIMTIEDPVEYNLIGINQVQVREEIGMDFAAALKAFLRQDPNIIMVGEIRDLETGSIGVRAALTGHLVLSTLHTNDAPSTIGRMIDMGIQPFYVATACNLIIAQRLVRKICVNCKEPTEYHPEILREIGIDSYDLKRLTLYKGRGCETCSYTGYKGRQGLYEVMPFSPEIRQMILENRSVKALRDQAAKDGMISLREDGLIKLKRGITTLEEVLRETALE